MALCRRRQHCGGQCRGRWTGTRRHRGHDLGCDRGQWRSRRRGWRHHRPTVLGNGFVVTWKKPLLDRVVLGFRWLGCEWLRRMGQGASGQGVRWEAEWEDRGRGGLRAQCCEVCCRSLSGHTGGKTVRRLQGGADGQVLFICHNSQSISHQAVGHTSICLLSDSTADKQYILDIMCIK